MLSRLRGSASRGASRVAGRSGLTIIGVLTLFSFSAPAHAEFGQLTLGLGISPYRPAMDTEISPATGAPIFPIYGCVFSDQTLAEIGADVDTHLYDGAGSIQFSMGFNLAQAQGKAQRQDAATSLVCGDPTSADVQLTLIKVRPGITYRLDPLLDLWQIPIVPYGRVGLVAATYVFTQDGAFEQGNVDPVGVRLGWETALGAMLALDFLDSIDPWTPNATRRGRANGSFDHTFIFVEGANQTITSFDQPGFILSPNGDTWLGTGWPVLWRVGVAVELL